MEAVNTTMWAFIDYENVGNLSKVDLSIYERVIVFVGAKQPKIDFGNKKYSSPIQFTLVQIGEVGANNLDFHLSYYLGRFDIEAPASVAFRVVSDDCGFGPLISYIRENGRVCDQIKVQKKKTKITDISGLIVSIQSKQISHRPKTIVSLRNHIASQMGMKGDDVAIQRVLNELVNQRVLFISENKVLYDQR